MGAATNGGVLVVFDFDETIINCDIEKWVVDAMGTTELFDELLIHVPWKSAVDAVLGELHAQGKTIEDITASIRTAPPISPRVITAIESAHAAGCELRILSDANAFFIEAVLARHGIAGYFSEIVTNPAFVDDSGRLRVLPYHDFHASSHGCTLGTCTPNICKGKVMVRMLQELSAAGEKKRRRVVHIGDGRGDYCPSLKLGERDYMMPRKGYPAWDLIASDRSAVRADVRQWADSEGLETVLLNIVAECATMEDHVEELVVPDCRVLNPSVASAQQLTSNQGCPCSQSK